MTTEKLESPVNPRVLGYAAAVLASVLGIAVLLRGATIAALFPFCFAAAVVGLIRSRSTASKVLCGLVGAVTGAFVLAVGGLYMIIITGGSL